MKRQNTKRIEHIKVFKNVRILMSVILNTSYDRNVSKKNLLVKSKISCLR
jgi:hypothetical protein